MPLTTSALAKEAEQSYQPMLLFTFQFYDGTYLRLSTHPLNVAEGGAQYGGNDYLARIATQTLGAIQERSEQGIERLPSISIKILDQDFFVWTNFESALGFRDATCTVQLIFGETNGWTFSSDSYNVFIGICDAPVSIDPDGTITISAASSNNLQKKYLPVLQAQARCPHTFPSTAAQRLDGSGNRQSLHFGCGYNPDQVSGVLDPDTFGDKRRGNLNSGVPFTTCNYTKGDCVARGMYTRDSANRVTGRFGGIQFVPDQTIKNYINYGTGNKGPQFRLANSGIIGKPLPLRYGTAWGAPLIANSLGDGNYTRFEMVFCGGNVGDLYLTGPGPVLQVVMNGVSVPHNNGSSDPKNLGLRWDLVTVGRRSGAPTTDNGYGSQGDPYGGMAMIYAALFNELAASNSLPSVNVLAQGMFVEQPNTANPADVAGWPYSYSENPAFCVADFLIRCGFRWADLNIQSFITAAAICAASVSYIDNSGNSNSHARYIIGTYIGDAKLGSELLNSMLRGFNAQVYRDKITGLIGIMIRQSIADQQPAPIDGSNYNTGISAVNAAGGTGTGYVAYAFDESNTISIRTVMSPNAAAGNKIVIPILDADNGYVQDWSSVTDTDDAARGQWANSGSIVNSNFVATGIVSFDQAFRISRTYLAEQGRGNEQQDTRGTRRFEIKTTFRISHLRVGQIVLCRYAQKPNNYTSTDAHLAGLGFLARVIKIEGTTNFEGMTTTVEWTESAWYADAYGQSVPPQYSDPRKDPPNRAPYAWRPTAASRYTDDFLFPGRSSIALDGSQLFDFAITYAQAASGDAAPVVSAFGGPIVNQFGLVHPPLIASQGIATNTGGSVLGGAYFASVTAVDSAGNESAESVFCLTTVAAGITAGTITIPIKSTFAGTSSFNVYVGTSPLTKTWQGNFAVASSITFTALLLERQFGPPDQTFNNFHLRGRYILLPGVAVRTVSAVVETHHGFSNNTAKIAIGATFATNFNGYAVSKIEGDQVPFASPAQPNYSVVSNDGTYLVTSQLAATINAIRPAFTVGDVVAIRATGKTVTANTIKDPAFVNTFSTGIPSDAAKGYSILFIAGKGAGQEKLCIGNTADTLTIAGAWDITPDATSVFIVVAPNWDYDGAGTHVDNNLWNGYSGDNLIGSIALGNSAGAVFLVDVLTEDLSGNSMPDIYAPFREVYIAGDPGTGSGGAGVEVTVTTTATIAVGVTQVWVDGTLAPYTITIPDPSTLTQPITLTRSEVPATFDVVTVTPAAGTLNGLASLPLDNTTYSSITIAKN